MARIGTESRRMGALVDDLLLLARLDQGRPVRHDPVDLSRIVDDAVADARALEPARPINASIERRGHRGGRRGPAAPGDRQPVRQRPGPHAGRRRRSRSRRAMDGESPSCGSSTTGRASTSPSVRRCSTASIAPIPAARATTAAPASGCRSRRPWCRRTRVGSGTRRRPAAGRRSWSGCRCGGCRRRPRWPRNRPRLRRRRPRPAPAPLTANSQPEHGSPTADPASV